MNHTRRSKRRRPRSGALRHLRNNVIGKLRPLALVAVLGMTGTAGSVLPQTPPPVGLPQPPQQPQRMQPPASGPAPVKEMPLDPALRIIAEARQVYSQIKTYECTMISQERVNNMLQPEEVIQMTFRKEPFSVYMKWLVPADKVRQDVYYVQGRNQNRMKVKAPVLGWLDIATNDPKVFQHSRHTILEAGFGNLIERCDKCWTAERLTGKTQVQMAEFEYNKRRCIRIETIHTVHDKSAYCYRNVVYFDKEWRIPVRMECYDWPQQRGPQGGELLECFSYVDLKFNVNVPDGLFK